MIYPMNKTKLLITSIFIPLFTFNVFAAPKVIDSVVAVVNNSVVLESDVNEMLQNIKKSTNPSNLPDDDTLKHQIIERLITENLILQQAVKQNITVTDDDVMASIRDIARKNSMSLDDLRVYITKSGMSFNSYRNKIRNEMLLEEVRMNEIRKRVKISEREVEDLANIIAKQPMNNRDVNISHILISIPEKASKQQIDRAAEKANDIVVRLKNGESFAKLAASYSNDENAFKGGSMGWHKITELPSIFEAPLIKAQKNDIIGPIRSGVGFHIIKVDGNRAVPQKSPTINEVNARHILIKTNVIVTNEVAKQKILDIRKSIARGSISFEQAAKEYSEDPGSADNGGELGWNDPDRYDTAFKTALLKLKKGEISQPVKSAYGWHLIQLINFRSVDGREQAMKNQAYRLIFNRKFSEELAIWIQELKGDAYIKISGDDTNNE